MNHRWRCSILALGLLASVCFAGTDEKKLLPQISFSAHDRILVLAPHPDDEVIGCGGIIQKAVAMKLPMRVVFFTNGDNNEWSFLFYRKRPVIMPKAVQDMGELRVDEAIAAAQRLSVPTNQLTFLGYPDFGTLTMWERHWGSSAPYRSLLTRVKAVPYDAAMRPGAGHKGEEVVRDLTTVLREFRPTKIFVSHPADHNGDHRALYLFLRVALWGMESELKPEILPYWIHIGGWPKPRGFHPELTLQPPPLYDEIPWRTFPMAPDVIERKRGALEAYASQYRSSGQYLLTFVRANELFGDFPPFTLEPKKPPTALTPHAAGAAAQKEPDDDLSDEARAMFVGVVTKSLALEADDLVFTIELSRPLAPEIEASMYVFGWRGDVPFAEMPKLHVQLGHVLHAVYDQSRKLPGNTVRVKRGLKEISIRVPLKALANPQRILTSAHTHLDPVTVPLDWFSLPLDWVAWRTLDLAPNRQ